MQGRLPASLATPRFQLKAATDAVHQQLDDRLSTLDLADEADYTRFLLVHARTVPAVEAALAGAGIASLIEGWESARRSSAIAEDLNDLGCSAPRSVPPLPVGSEAEMLGIAYVLEGSRLGAKVLAPQVGEKFPKSFLSHSQGDTIWRQLVAALDRLLYSRERLDEAKSAAHRCFALFLNVAQEAGI